jgi:excisionase family DNA binding protein
MKTITDLAQEISVHRSTVSRYIKLGLIQAFRFGSIIRIPLDEYEQVLREGVKPK